MLALIKTFERVFNGFPEQNLFIRITTQQILSGMVSPECSMSNFVFNQLILFKRDRNLNNFLVQIINT